MKPDVIDPTEPRVTSTRSPGPVGQTETATASLRLDNLALRAGVCTVNNVSATLDSGEIAVLTGPVGVGKSTLLRVIAGVHPLESGHVFFAGRDVTADPPESRNLAWVPQGGGLLPVLTVRQQLAFPLDARGLPSSDAVDAAASHWQIEPLLDRRPDRLSGGEQQLVALARATIQSPVGLLLDEPFAALSESRREFARDLINQWRHNNPAVWTIVVTHRAEEFSHVTQSWTIDENGFQRR